MVAHVLHPLVFECATEQVEIGRSLKYIATIEQKYVRVLLFMLLNEGGKVGDTAFSGQGMIGGKWFDAGVQVIGVQQQQFEALY